MVRFSLLKSLVVLAMIAGLLGGLVVPLSAQDDATPTEEIITFDEETESTEPVDEPQYGWLQISAVVCSVESGTDGVTIQLATDYVPSGDCADDTSALLIDGIDYGPVAPYLELSLETGNHALYEPSSGAYLDVWIDPNDTTPVVIVRSVAAPTPTEEPVVEPASASSDLLVVAHACIPDIQTVDQLYALGNRTARMNDCPAFTLPGHAAPGGSVTGGEFWFDVTLTPAVGDAQSLTGNGVFVPDAFCESEVGPLDNDWTNDRCVSTSGYWFEVPDGSITLTQLSYPDTMRYVVAEVGSDADAGIITSSDPAAGYLGLDTSLAGTAQPVVHLYYLNPPRVNIVVHVCDPSITTPDDLVALGSLVAQLLNCPAIGRSAETGSGFDFGVTVGDVNWGIRNLDNAFFEFDWICESDIGEWDGDTGTNLCLEAPIYRFDQTAMGYVTVTQDFAPSGFVFGGVNSADPGTITSIDLESAMVELDTSFDGDVTMHLFDLVAIPATQTPTATASRTPHPPTQTATITRTPVPPTATGTATATSTQAAATQTMTPSPTIVPPTSTSTSEPGGTGTVIVAALYCLSGSGTTIIALPPGQTASASDMGGADCFSGDATIQLTLADGSSIPAFKLGRDGVESIQNIPATGGTPHTISESLTGRSATFEIANGTSTRVIIRYGAGSGLVEEGVISSGGTAGTSGPGGGLITDELIGDAGVASSAASFSGVSFTSLVIDDVAADAQAISSVKDAKSLPAVGVSPVHAFQHAIVLATVLGVLLGLVALITRRSQSRTPES